MELLNIKTRQLYLKELGFYKGEIDGIEGKLTKQSYLKLQLKYFNKATRRKDDCDGLYGPDTDILLRNAYAFKRLGIKHFKLTEFKCKCKKYCTGYPVVLDDNLLIGLDKTREHFGKMAGTSGMRCKTHNENIKGSSKTSRHLLGKAFDCKVSGYTSLSKRREVIDYWIENVKSSRYAYCDDYSRNQTSKGYKSYPNMGKSIHLDVK